MKQYIGVIAVIACKLITSTKLLLLLIPLYYYYKKPKPIKLASFIMITTVQSNLAKGRIAVLLPMSLSKVLLPVGIWTPSNTWFMDPHKSAPMRISIGSAVYAQLIRVTNTQTRKTNSERYIQTLHIGM